jgi:hypothetical protein
MHAERLIAVLSVGLLLAAACRRAADAQVQPMIDAASAAAASAAPEPDAEASAPVVVPSLCALASPVDKVTYALECDHEGFVDGATHRTIDITSVAPTKGRWQEKRNGDQVSLNDYESTQFDALLTEAMKRICRGERDEGVRYTSLHRPELGWPLDACRGRRVITVWKGREKLALPDPLVRQVSDLELIVHMHDFGKHLAAPDAGPRP